MAVEAGVSSRLPRSLRIRTRRQFLRIQGSGRRVHGQMVFAVASPNGLPQVRLGITVTRRVGGAVVRNRLKRWLREAFRRARGAFPPGLDVVFIVKREGARADWAAIEADVASIARRLRGQRAG